MAAADTAATVPPSRRRSKGLSERRLAAAMLSPTFAIIALVAAYPIGYAIYLSLQEYSVRTPGLSRFAGERNYFDAIGSTEFQEAFVQTFVFAFSSVLLELIIGIVMALCMHEAFKGRSLLRATVLVPWAVLTVVTAFTWRSLFDPDLGFVTQMFAFLGFDTLADTVWLGERGYAMSVMVIADVWKTAPFMGLLLLAGLQVISSDIYDAAKVDGATAWQRFRSITLPLLKPAILVALIFRTLDALRVFDLPYVLTNGANGTETLSTYAQSVLVEQRITGLGSALSVITFVTIMIVSFLYIRFVGGNIRDMAAD